MINGFFELSPVFPPIPPFPLRKSSDLSLDLVLTGNNLRECLARFFSFVVCCDRGRRRWAFDFAWYLNLIWSEGKKKKFKDTDWFEIKWHGNLNAELWRLETLIHLLLELLWQLFFFFISKTYLFKCSFGQSKKKCSNKKKNYFLWVTSWNKTILEISVRRYFRSLEFYYSSSYSLASMLLERVSMSREFVPEPNHFHIQRRSKNVFRVFQNKTLPNIYIFWFKILKKE